MEEANSLITQGCKLAKDLESILANPDPVLVSNFCDDIINTFTAAKERLMAAGSSSTSQVEASLHEWVRANNISPSPVDMWLQMQLMEGKGDMGAGGTSSSFMPLERGDHASNVQTAARASSSQRPRSSRRKEDARTVRVAAPQMGNTEIPPEDGFTWRKYGQKNILAARFPRGYYRCTHQKLYNCPAKKQVQRLDHDPSTFEITYYGEHSCHKTATAPSVPPPAATSSSQQLVYSPPGWLEFSLGGTGPSSSGTAYNRDYPVADLADTMFNSGSSSTNSMDFLFTHHHT